MVEKYSKDYLIRTYECDKNGELRLVTLMNIFQDMADEHAAQMGLGLEYCLGQRAGLGRLQLSPENRTNAAPSRKNNADNLACGGKKLGAVRDFVINDAAGTEIVCASSQWILIDAAKKRPLALRENLPQYYTVAGRSMDEEFNARLPEAEREDYRIGFNVRFDDIDLNNHVNNAVYPLWASEAVPGDFRQSRRIAELEVAFKKECRFGEKVEVATELNGAETRHRISAVSDGRELSRVRIVWK